MNEKQAIGYDFLCYALYVCASLALELLLLFIERIIGIDINSFTTTQYIIHWIITSALWIVAGLLACVCNMLTR